MDPLSIIASTIAVAQAISSTYKAIQDLRGLPNEFKEVNQKLPLVQETLGLVRNKLQGLALEESSKQAILPLVSDCEEKAEMLQDIFEKVEKKAKKAKDGSVLDFYRTFLLRLGKAHRVETLMLGILTGLDALATNQLFKTEIQIAELKEAIDRLSNVQSSVPDSYFESSGTNTQNIASGGTGSQSNISGHGHNINSGSSGTQFNVNTMNFDRSNEITISNSNFKSMYNSGGGDMYIDQSSEDSKSRGDILQALYTSKYLERKNRNPDPVSETCKWFIDHDHFQQWRESKSSTMLWVSANPGCGKSVLAKHLVDSELKTTESRMTCYFFFKDDFDDQKSATSALCCILHQIFRQKKNLFSNKIVERLEAFKAHLTSSFDELWEVLVMAAQDNNAGELVCILDAFDECEDQERDKLAKALRNLYDTQNDTKNNVNLKFLVTSRPYDKIKRGFQPLNVPGFPFFHLEGESDAEISKITKEINVYIIDRISHIRKRLCLDKDEVKLLEQGLQRNSHQTYLWVYLTLNLIEHDIGINKAKIREVMSSLPETVNDAYEKILDKSSNSEEAKKLLHIIVAAARPLTLAEVELALAIKKHHGSYQAMHNVWVPEERFGRYVRDLCGLFITITGSKIYLFHQTAKEFLVRKDDSDPRGNNQLIWKSSLQPLESHRILAEICIWYLRLAESETRPDEKKKDVKYDVFIDYSAKHWAAHLRDTHIETQIEMAESILKICDVNSRCCQTWFRIYWTGTNTDFPQEFTTLMIASYFGLSIAVNRLLKEGGIDLNARDNTYQRSALSWAAGNGFDVVVELLIAELLIKHTSLSVFIRPFCDTGVDSVDTHGRTPLSYAAWSGNVAAVKLLIEAGAQVDKKDKIGGRPLYYAFLMGHKEVMELLHKKGTRISPGNDIRKELLLSAANRGDEKVVELLLNLGVEIDVKDKDGRTTLSSAAENELESILKLHYGTGKVDVNTEDETGRTPLSWAAANGRASVAKLLLDTGEVVIDTRDYQGRAPLLYAAMGGHDAIVKQLLEKEANVNSQDVLGATALHWAANKRHEDVFLRLLKQIDIDTKDEGGGTALTWAIESNFIKGIEMLLAKSPEVNYIYTQVSAPIPWIGESHHRIDG